MVNPGLYTEDGIISRINFIDSGGTNNSIIAAKNQFVFNGAPITVSAIGNSLSYLCQLPNKSGTIALTDDISTGGGVELYNLYGSGIFDYQNTQVTFYFNVLTTKPGTLTLAKIGQIRNLMQDLGYINGAIFPVNATIKTSGSYTNYFAYGFQLAGTSINFVFRDVNSGFIMFLSSIPLSTDITGAESYSVQILGTTATLAIN